jgi:hypothetical protein
VRELAKEPDQYAYEREAQCPRGEQVEFPDARDDEVDREVEDPRISAQDDRVPLCNVPNIEVEANQPDSRNSEVSDQKKQEKQVVALSERAGDPGAGVAELCHPDVFEGGELRSGNDPSPLT